MNRVPVVASPSFNNPILPETKRLLGVQAARGVAALMVVVYHAARSLALPQYVGTNALGGIFEFGHAGVDFFFVLSGFIITHVHYGDLGKRRRLPLYVWRRFTRIYPIYWLVTLIYLMVGVFAPDAAVRFNPIKLLESLTLLPAGHEPLIPVAWTLEHEMLFYCVFGMAIWNRKLAGLAILVGLAPLAVSFFPSSRSPLYGFLLTPFHIEFLMGAMAARLVSTCTVRGPFAVVAAGLALFVLAAVLDVQGSIKVNELRTAVLFGGSSALIVAGVVEAERSGRLRLGMVAELFGGASYVLYLIHPLVLGLTARSFAFMSLLGVFPPWCVVVVQVAASMMTAIMLHRKVEQPLIRRFQRVGRRALNTAPIMPP